VEQAQQYQAAGYRWVVDLDLEKFFDRVNHDRLLAKIAERVSDKRLLRLIRAYLRVGVMENGLVSPAEEGTPQGGPLSPVLSNIVLNELDQELERRGHRFTRYADDCNICVRSRRAGERVMSSVTRLLTTKLKLRVNSEKSAVARDHGNGNSWVQLHESQGTEEALGAESGRAIQGASPGTYASDTGDQSRPYGP
jgi:RNA-directed DNA polymerase